MKYIQLDPSPTGVHVLIADPGEEGFGMIVDFATQRGITAAEVTGIGALSSAVIAYFDAGEKRYHNRTIDEQCELVSLVGNLSVGEDGTPVLHAHVGLALADGTLRGGHLVEAHVNPTLEVVVREHPQLLRRVQRDNLGLAVIDPDETTTAGS